MSEERRRERLIQEREHDPAPVAYRLARFGLEISCLEPGFPIWRVPLLVDALSVA